MSGSKWTCEVCQNTNPPHRKTCGGCRAKNPNENAMPKAQNWECAECTFSNLGTRQKCSMCRAAKPVSHSVKSGPSPQLRHQGSSPQLRHQGSSPQLHHHQVASSISRPASPSKGHFSEMDIPSEDSEDKKFAGLRLPDRLGNRMANEWIVRLDCSKAALNWELSKARDAQERVVLNYFGKKSPVHKWNQANMMAQVRIGDLVWAYLDKKGHWVHANSHNHGKQLAKEVKNMKELYICMFHGHGDSTPLADLPLPKAMPALFSLFQISVF